MRSTPVLVLHLGTSEIGTREGKEGKKKSRAAAEGKKKKKKRERGDLRCLERLEVCGDGGPDEEEEEAHREGGLRGTGRGDRGGRGPSRGDGRRCWRSRGVGVGRGHRPPGRGHPPPGRGHPPRTRARAEAGGRRQLLGEGAHEVSGAVEECPSPLSGDRGAKGDDLGRGAPVQAFS